MNTTRNLASNINVADQAFDTAIAQGRLSDNIESPLFAGNFMYMGYYNNKDNFKNIVTREYIA